MLILRLTLVTFGLALSSCAQSPEGFFMGGHTRISISSNSKFYGYHGIGGPKTTDKKLINCSNDDYICIKGPFNFLINRSILMENRENGRKFIDISVPDGDDVTCVFRYKLDEGEGITYFKCIYNDGSMGSPKYSYYRIIDGNEVSSAFNIWSL